MQSLRFSTSTLRMTAPKAVTASSALHRTIHSSSQVLTRHQPATESPSSTQSQCQQDIQAKVAAQESRTLIDRQSSEYSNSGTDDAVAAQSTSYTPNTTSTADPREAIAQAADEIHHISTTTATSKRPPMLPPSAGFNPLEVSPANIDISSTTSEFESSTLPPDGQMPSQSKTYVGTATQKSKSTVSTTTERKRIFAGGDTRKDVRPGAEQREIEQQKGRGPVLRPGPR